MNDLLLRFIHAHLGQINYGTNPVNAGQCVGLVEGWWQALGLPWVSGNAVDLLNLAPLTRFTLTRNNPTNYPQTGAVVCWNESWGGGFGHTAVVIAANVHFLCVFEQNDPDGSPPIVGTHGYTGVDGWLMGKDPLPVLR